MMATKVKLLRPLDGMPIGSVVDYPEDDAKRLESTGVVSFVNEKAAPAPLNKMAKAPRNKAAGRGFKKGG